MKKKDIMKRFSRKLAVVILAGALVLSGCAGNSVSGNGNGNKENTMTSAEGSSGDGGSGTDGENLVVSGSGSVKTALSGVSTLDVSDMFSKKDQNASYEESECVIISLNGDTATCKSDDVTVEGGTVTIKAAGSYILRGTLQNGSIRIEAPDDAKVQLILDGVEITTNGTAGIYAKTADKVFITLAENTVNTIQNTGDFVAIDDNNIDGAIFSKCDLTLNAAGSDSGIGKLIVSSEKGHGIVSKDDLKVVGGTYEINAGSHGISGKDSIRIADGNLNITCTKDGLHSGNDEDADKGYVYIADGNITISAGDDGIHGESKVVIADGTINVAKSYEGIEAAIIEVAGGDITVNASDDGLNATDGSGGEGFGGFGGGFGGFEGFDGNFEGRGRQQGNTGETGKKSQQGNAGETEKKPQQGSTNDTGKKTKQGTTENATEKTQQRTSGNTNADVYILISGGKLVVNARGDGLDSNGKIYVKGGETYVSGPENNGNGALDYDSSAEVTGGSLIAVGSTGMAMNFSNSTQGSALLTLSSTHNAGEEVKLTDSKGNVLLSYVPTCKFASVVVTCQDMKQGETYTLTVGSETQEFTLEDLIYGKSNGFGGMGGGRPGNMGGDMRGNMDGDMGGDRRGNMDGDMRGGRRGGSGGFGENDGEMPEGFNGKRPEFPEGFDGEGPELPEGFNGERPEFPEGFDGEMPAPPEGFNG